jgi:hypothetical protein
MTRAECILEQYNRGVHDPEPYVNPDIKRYQELSGWNPKYMSKKEKSELAWLTRKLGFDPKRPKDKPKFKPYDYTRGHYGH